MKLRLALEDKMMDVRLRDRLLADGKISKADIDKYIDGLSPEDSSNFERLGGEEVHAPAPTTEQ